MSRELICAWLKLEASCQWPPDHYTLLGLTPGEVDAASIGGKVQERHELLLRYQLNYPEQVTEAMNRLCQAYLCLSDAASKRAYDAAHFPQLVKKETKARTATPTVPPRPLPKATGAMPAGAAAAEPTSAKGPTTPVPTKLPTGTMRATPPEQPKAAPPPTEPAPAANLILPPAAVTPASPPPPAAPLPPLANVPETQQAVPAGADEPLPPDPLAWLYGPWAEAGAGALPSNGVPEASKTEAAPPAAFPSAPPPELAGDPALQVACSRIARRDLVTKRSFYHRISSTRKLIRAWIHAGKYLADAQAKLVRKEDAIDLVRQLTTIRQQLQDFPPLLGRAGQPGYLVIVLARQQLIVHTFLNLSSSQREAMVRDWQAGLTLLAAHRLFLRQELRALRHGGTLGMGLRILKAGVARYPWVWLFVLAGLGLNLVYPELWQYWPLQILAFLALLVVLFLITGLAETTDDADLRRTRRAKPRADRLVKAPQQTS